ncbi:G-type lectin S-receptor-like serine/threonine-protein kinase LECRK3 [Linum perenne]
MPNGTLASFMFSASLKLDWHHRVRISTRIARGLVYLFTWNRDFDGYGYVAPEWFKADVAVTSKVDVYSFRVMLLEIICCRNNIEIVVEEEKVMLIDWAHECFVKGRVGDLLVVGGEEDQVAAIDEKWVSIALWCVQEDPKVRLGMKRVLEMLEGLVELPSLLAFGSG